MQTDDHLSIMEALGDSMRDCIVAELHRAGPQSATQLSAVLPISRQAIVKHLEVLESARIVRRTPQGRSVAFTLCPETLAATSKWLGDRALLWQQRLDRLESVEQNLSTR